MGNLITAAALQDRLGADDLRIVDVRFDLADPSAGRRAYRAGHVPGATYLHLEEDLSGRPGEGGRGGRHPLPDPERFAARLGELGIGDSHEVVAYDGGSGAFAARAWWLLRWISHERVRVLDGGFDAWQRVGGEAVTSVPRHPRASHAARVNAGMVVDGDWVERHLNDPSVRLVDARAPERYRGDTEPIDPVAGHVPGAVNLPFAGNLDEDRFAASESLRRRYAHVAGAEEVVMYCGSGVTAAHDVLAMEEAGLGLPRLYAGSWSDWCSRPGAPVERGDTAAGEGA